MKVALVHDYIKEYGGAERVLEALHEIWPTTPVYTSVYLPEFLGPHQRRFKDWKIITSIFQNLPFKEKMISPMRIFPLIFQNWDFSKYEVIIVSATGAYIPNLINKQRALHICYCHTPPRYLYGYPTARNWRKTFFGRVAGELINHKLRLTDFEGAQRVDYFIANSNEIRKRIKKFYRREASVIYPPVEMVDKIKNNKKQITNNKNKNYYLAGGRLARAKHIDLAIAAANEMKFNLKIFGKGFAGYDRELKSMAGPTVQFVGEVGDDELKDLYENCRVLIYPSEFEDFGIMPIEAQIFGKPLIAFRQGGVLESVIEGKTGIFFDELSVDSLVTAIKKLEKTKILEEDCIKNAQKFSKERFKKEMLQFVERHA